LLDFGSLLLEDWSGGLILQSSPHRCIVIVQMRDGLQESFDIVGKFLVNGFKYFLQTINVSDLILVSLCNIEKTSCSFA
jgi:hypothetical protein